MDISCNIIKDLLPLYAEDMVSDDSKKMVDEHLCGCDDCTKELAAIKKAPKVPLEVDVKSLKRVGDTIRRRRILTVVTAVLLVITILVSAVSWLQVKIWLEADEAVISVEAMEDGRICFNLNDGVMNHDGVIWYNADKDVYYGHSFSTTRYEKLRAWWYDLTGKEAMSNRYIDENLRNYDGDAYAHPGLVPEDEWIEIPATDGNHYYYNVYDCTYDVLLWDAGLPFAEMTINGRCDILSQNFWAAVGLTALFAALAYLIKKPWVRELFTRFGITAGSVVFSALFLTGGKFVVAYVHDEPYGTLKWIYLVSVFITLTALFARRLHQLNQLDKAI